MSAMPDDAELVACLGERELARLQQLSAPQRRRQFLAGHWLARRMASEHAGGAIGDWQWCVDTRGQPSLEREGRRLCISVSHSDEWIACAVAEQAIGIDVEASQRLRDWDRLAAHTFASGNLDGWHDLEPSARRDRFVLLWSLHEARAKRSGDGLSLTDTRGLRVSECDPAQAEACSWQVAGGGALALAGDVGLHVELVGPANAASYRYWRFQQ